MAAMNFPVRIISLPLYEVSALTVVLLSRSKLLNDFRRTESKDVDKDQSMRMDAYTGDCNAQKMNGDRGSYERYHKMQLPTSGNVIAFRVRRRLNRASRTPSPDAVTQDGPESAGRGRRSPMRTQTGACDDPCKKKGGLTPALVSR
jgi:hypothetical protein